MLSIDLRTRVLQCTDNANQESMYASTGYLHKSLGARSESTARRSQSWRQDSLYYKSDTEWSDVPPGVVNMSPAWFQQAHDVCLPLHLLPALLTAVIDS